MTVVFFHFPRDALLLTKANAAIVYAVKVYKQSKAKSPGYNFIKYFEKCFPALNKTKQIYISVFLTL